MAGFQSAGNGRPSAGRREYTRLPAGFSQPGTDALRQVNISGIEPNPCFSQPGTDALRQELKTAALELPVSVSRERTPFGRGMKTLRVRVEFQSAGNGRPSAGKRAAAFALSRFQSAGNGRPSAGTARKCSDCGLFQSAGNGRPSAGPHHGVHGHLAFQSAGNGRPSAGQIRVQPTRPQFQSAGNGRPSAGESCAPP